TLYRGRGVTVERVLDDLHSGRIFARAGTLVMDAVAVFMIVLSLSGFVLWLQRGRREAELERRADRRR
ncbi:MAG TPA: PepSY-associated TM helix domain-containing protein, partial [Woeseiaceae bacterium]|nr:PepSY-associated TM helix domain-containing protein [Woeseiaceae bacterium]